MSTAAVSWAEQPATKTWLPNLIGLGVLVVAILVLFREPIVAAVQVWWIYPAYSHCFLILPISLWLVWEKRQELAASVPTVTLAPLLVLPAILVLWAFSELAAINEGRQLAVVGFLQLAIWGMIGTRLYLRLLFPALYLFFLVPMGEYLIMPLQHITTQIADIGLSLLGVPHFTEGTVIELTNGRYEIAEACAGLRFLTATIALGTLYAYLSFRRWYKAALFLIACVVIPIASNGLRVLGTILLAHATNNRIGAGADHIIYGWGFNVAILLALMFIGSLFRDKVDDDTSGRDEAGTSRSALTAISATVLVFLGAFGVGPALAAWHYGAPMESNVTVLLRPLVVQGFSVGPAERLWHPNYLGADQELALTLNRLRDPPIAVYVEYYRSTRPGHSLITHLNNDWDANVWHSLEASRASAQLGNETLRLQETVISSPAESRLIWTTYWVAGRLTASALSVKLWQAASALQGNQGEALIAVSTPIDGDADAARTRLASALRNLGEIPARLGAAGTRSGRPR